MSYVCDGGIEANDIRSLNATSVTINSDSIVIIENTTACVNPTSGALQVAGGVGVSGSVCIAGSLEVIGDNEADRFRTTGAPIVIGTSAPPTTGQALLATSATTAEWQTITNGDVVGPASSTDNEIVRFDSTTGKLIQSDSSSPTTIDDNGFFSGPLIEISNSLVTLGSGISKVAGPFSTVIGNNAGSSLTGLASSNTFVGFNSGGNTTIGNENTFIGRESGSNNTDGIRNVFIGEGSGLLNTTGNNNTFIGRLAGQNNTTGNQNTLIGNGSGSNMTTQTGCVILGNEAGQNNTLSNRLMIDNTNTNTPLLDGDFISGTLTVNGALTVMNNTTLSSDLIAYGETQEREYIELINKTQVSGLSSVYNILWQTLNQQSGSITYTQTSKTTFQIGPAGVYLINFSYYISGGSSNFAYIRTASNSAMSTDKNEFIQEVLGSYGNSTIVTYLPANYYIDTYVNYGTSYIFGFTGTPVRYPRVSITRISW